MRSTLSAWRKGWCAREDLNLQSFRNQILSLARLPFRHARARPEHACRVTKAQVGLLLPPSTPRKGEPERSHFFAIANQQDIACKHWMVPRLAFDRREPRELPELVEGRADQRQFTLLR